VSQLARRSLGEGGTSRSARSISIALRAGSVLRLYCPPGNFLARARLSSMLGFTI